MKRPRFPRRWLVPLGALLLPPLAWSLLIAVMPTEWARARVVARLEAATGRPVALGALRVGLLGGLVLRDLAVATPGKAADPWLKISSARLNVSIVQLLCGQIDPTDLDVAVNGVWICRDGGPGESRDLVDLTARDVSVTIDLKSGDATATVWTNDLTHAYVHENSAYSS